MRELLFAACVTCLFPTAVYSADHTTSVLETPLVLDTARFLRRTTSTLLGGGPLNTLALHKARANGMLQEIYKFNKFPCEVNQSRSSSSPTNVNMVRPGDIDIIGAMGDSLTSALGLTATQPFEIIVEHRGKSWSIGGEEDWKTYFTLPNVLKVFNPNLFGYSLRSSVSVEKDSQFNVAEPGALSSGMPYMASVLIKRMKSDSRVNMEDHWKLVTIMIGANDFCLNTCSYNPPEKILFLHKQHMLKALRILRDNLPRTIVNVVPPPNIQVLAETTNKPLRCYLTHSFECPCIFGSSYRNFVARYYKVMKQWQKIEEDISYMLEFQKDDFAVVFQPFTLNIDIPKNAENYTDFSNLSYDCFHLSQKFNAEAANALWNNMLEPVGQKTNHSHPLYTKILCPSQEKPYIFTRFNSKP